MLDCVWVKVGKGSAISGDAYGHPNIADGTRICTSAVKSVPGGLFTTGKCLFNPTFVGERQKT